jgi:hypothetical protein
MDKIMRSHWFRRLFSSAASPEIKFHSLHFIFSGFYQALIQIKNIAVQINEKFTFYTPYLGCSPTVP